jgi:PAS domain S-box-containing protein
MSKPSECGSLAHLHSMIVDRIPDAVVAVGRDGCIMSWNRAAERLFGLSADAVLGRRAHDVQLSPWFSAEEEAAIASAAERGEVLRREGFRSAGNGGPVHLELSIAPLAAPDGVPAGTLVVMRDISGAKQKERALEQRIEALRRASDRLRLSEALIPICAHCKQIRDPGGSWHEMDAYLHDQFGAKFTHGICPACITRLHPDYCVRPPTAA